MPHRLLFAFILGSPCEMKLKSWSCIQIYCLLIQDCIIYYAFIIINSNILLVKEKANDVS